MHCRHLNDSFHRTRQRNRQHRNIHRISPVCYMLCRQIDSQFIPLYRMTCILNCICRYDSFPHCPESIRISHFTLPPLILALLLPLCFLSLFSRFSHSPVSSSPPSFRSCISGSCFFSTLSRKSDIINAAGPGTKNIAIGNFQMIPPIQTTTSRSASVVPI